MLSQVHVRHTPASTSQLGYNQNWLADLTAAWKEAGLWITRAKVGAGIGQQGHRCVPERFALDWLVPSSRAGWRLAAALMCVVPGLC
jgi:hypothetical protein